MALYLRASLVWLAIIPLAILNGGIRIYWLIPALGEGWAHIASSIILSAVIFVMAWYTLRHTLGSSRQAMIVGLMWVTFTVLFEFGFGHYVMGHAWTKLLADYNVFQGRVWVLVLVSEFFAPLFAFRFR